VNEMKKFEKPKCEIIVVENDMIACSVEFENAYCDTVGGSETCSLEGCGAVCSSYTGYKRLRDYMWCFVVRFKSCS